ncbi:hypothetical protein, partial [Obesumbacterium proteus]|uniref:hypothetical protein n=1 Tax=Obesumbacterium proteus TaxID=82983 RepID=UPI00242D69D1
DLAKVGVASSSLVSRSNFLLKILLNLAMPHVGSFSICHNQYDFHEQSYPQASQHIFLIPS